MQRKAQPSRLKKIRFTSRTWRLRTLYQLADAEVHFIRFSKRKKWEEEGGVGGGQQPVKISRRLNIYLRKRPLVAVVGHQGWQGVRRALPEDHNRCRNCRPRRSCTNLSPTGLPAISSPRFHEAVEPPGFQKYPESTAVRILSGRLNFLSKMHQEINILGTVKLSYPRGKLRNSPRMVTDIIVLRWISYFYGEI